MTIGFQRPSGSAADVKELEYVSALHQTDLRHLRKDGSITDEDIVLFLLSRYGIKVTTHDATTPQDALPEGVVRPREGLVDYVLSMVLHDTTGSHAPKKLDEELIQRILISYGESELASNNALVQEMLEAAQTPEETLNLEAFSKGLTHDVQLYDIGSEARVSTNYDDVFLTKNHRDDWKDDDGDEEEAEKRRCIARERKSMSRDLKTCFTAPAIDMVAATFRSKVIIVLLWTTYIITAFAYTGFGNREPVVVCEEEDTEFQYGQSFAGALKPMACAIGSSVLGWLAVFFFASLYGALFIGASSTGNKITCRRFWLPIVGVAFVMMFTIGPYVDDVVFVSGGATYLPTVSVVLAIITSIFHLFHSLSMLTPKWVSSKPKLQPLFTSGIIRAESNIKKAAAHKVSVMTDNALDLAENKDKDTVMETHFGQGLLAFEKAGKTFAPAGGFVWTWTRICNGSLFKKEGIWLSARLLASNAAQFIVAVFVLIAGIQIMRRIDENYDIEEARRVAGSYVEILFNKSVSETITAGMTANFSLILTEFLYSSVLNDACANVTNLTVPVCENIGEYVSCDSNASLGSDYLCTLLDSYSNSSTSLDGVTALGLLNASGFDASGLVETSRDYLQTASRATVDSLYPSQKYMVRVPAILGTIVAFITALSLAVTYIPSVTSTTLKLRSGVIPSLRNPGFSRYRFAADMVTILTGSMFWGCLIASILVGGLCGIVLFLFLWQATVSLTQRVVALIIGISVVMVLKLVLVSCCRVSFYQAFYRKKPAAANISALALECTNFSLSVGFVFLRMCKLIVAAALFVGRIDTPFLADGVCRVGGVELDGYPAIFLKDTLAHEAHRHPFIELMGVFYLYKLRYGRHFGKRAGTTWRLIFVSALFPWLNKYRILERDEPDEVDDLELEVHDATANDGAFEAVLPFERALSANAVELESSATEPPKRPSHLMTKFQSLRTTFNDTNDASRASLKKQPTKRRLSSRASTRGSLLVQQLDGTQGELQQRNVELEVKVVGLESNVKELEAEVDRLRQELGARKTKRFQSANNTDDLHDLRAKSG